jgi:phage I-like protein
MNPKKNLITSIIIVIVVIAIGIFFWKGGFSKRALSPNTISPTEENTTQNEMGTNENTTTNGQIGNVEKVTDDVYVELMAQAAYLSQKSPATYVSEMQKLYSKYGLTQESFTAYGDELGKDPVRTQEIMQKYTQRLQELMK